MSGASGAAPAPLPFRIGNVAIHTLAALALFGVVRRTLSAGGPPEWRAQSLPIAGAVALLWTVHPLQTSAVTYIIQRAEALVGLFLLLTLYCSIRAAGPRAGTWTAAAVACCALGMGSKETMVVAPFLVLAWDWFFGVRAGESFGQLLRRRRVLYAGLAATWGVLIVTIAQEPRAGAVGFHFAEWPWWRYLATQAGVIVHYLRLVFVPGPLVLDYGWPPVPSIAAALPAITFVAGLIGLTVAGALRRHPAAFAGIVFFLVLAPTSSVLPIVTEVAAEHRMYLPLAAVISLAVCAGLISLRRLQAPAFAAICTVCASATLLGWLTCERNRDYGSEERIWADTISKRPENPRARINYGVVLLEQQRMREAEPHLRKAVALDGTDSDARLALGALLCSSDRCDEGIVHLRRAAEIDPLDPNVVRNLAEALASRREWREASRHFRRAAALSPDDVMVLNQASWLLATAPADDVRDGQAALTMAERAVALTERRDPTSLDSLAVAYAELGRFAEAERSIREAIAAAERQGQASLAGEFRQHLLRIQARTPVR
jgi:Flp pilus assembly protein TadD